MWSHRRPCGLIGVSVDQGGRYCLVVVAYCGYWIQYSAECPGSFCVCVFEYLFPMDLHRLIFDYSCFVGVYSDLRVSRPAWSRRLRCVLFGVVVGRGESRNRKVVEICGCWILCSADSFSG